MANATAAIKNMLPELPNEKIDMLAATSVLQQQASEIRAQRVIWQSYSQSQMISQEDYNFIVAFDNADAEGRKKILEENRTQCAKTFLNLLGHISKDQTIQYILILIDDMLQEDRSRVEIFCEYSARKKEGFLGPFLNLLNRPDGFIQNMTSRIIAKMACWCPDLMDKSDLHFYLAWLNDQLKINLESLTSSDVHALVRTITLPLDADGNGNGNQGTVVNVTLEMMNNEYMQSVARCLQMMLRIDEYRFAFVSVDGISTILNVLSGRVNFQVQYQLIFCLWVLTYNPLLAEKMNKFNVIPILTDILSDSVKEKVSRIILAVFRNLIEKPENPEISKEHCIAMVQCKVLKQLSILEQRKFDDEDICADVVYLNEKLQASVQDLSSFDEYASEVKSGRLEWSPVHKSAKFWRENASRLNEKNYELLAILIELLQQSKDPLVLSVASFDIGEYVRHYPRGKNRESDGIVWGCVRSGQVPQTPGREHAAIRFLSNGSTMLYGESVIEQLGGKQLVMQLLGHDDPNVRYEALIAVQKLMVHNWEYLGRQLEKEQTQPSTSAPGGMPAAKA